MDAQENEPPPWLVFGATARTVAMSDATAGLRPIEAALEDEGEIDAMGAEIIDRFGPPPAEVGLLLKLVQIKALCRRANVEKLEAAVAADANFAANARAALGRVALRKAQFIGTRQRFAAHG